METEVVVKMTAYYFAAFCFILLAVSNGKDIDVRSKDEDNTYLGERYRRDVTLPPPKCNDWSDWINNNHPGNNTNEIEKLSQGQLDQICPPSIGGYISKIRCKDSKGEPFSGKVNATSGDKTFVYTCMEPIDGATCYRANVNASCPDYSISFNCTCSPEMAARMTSARSTATTPSIETATAIRNISYGTGGGDGKSNSLSGGGSNNSTIGSSNVPWWLIPVLVAVVLFIINVILAVCLHKKAKQQVTQTVHPM